MSSESQIEDPARPMRLIGQVSRAFARLVDAPLRQLGFAIGQLPVLVTLKKAGALSQAELARMAQVEQSSMAQLLNRMERDNLVRRVPDPADGRSRLISLTARASRQMPNGKLIMDEVCETALTGFTSEERSQLVSLLLRIDANLEQALADRDSG
ncbi:transcriptional regulator [Burkholderia sp. Ch1-1]|uniref:Transcriptional regulator n=1 Tax=Paraburkholderia dioscoreae TaxID=2604047 RepID=A0A5Q4ZNG9_9BURK|nr:MULTISPECIES: MarR family winged helix-turn-helix transcriptional regulator [Paraburkholderia]EIF35113.1 transcriptional regulator [Burkholderia sp. Ch1-1]MDR8396331.1 MarR family winged helix-turn-helix transcriptional regulator [Paraburkholderia sp. USG1]VVD34313.1 Transcriptional regulator [Paraburkholderia dioscoreae]